MVDVTGEIFFKKKERVGTLGHTRTMSISP